MANTLQLKNDIKKIKTALASKNLSATFKNKLKVKLQKAESDLKASTPKGARATLTSLKEQVKKRGYGVYKGAGVDLQKDAKEPALAAGRRVSKGLKGNQYGNKKSSKGNVYYEYRANRIDVKQPSKSAKYPKLAKGGEVDEKLTENEYNKIVKKLDDLYGKDVDKSYIHIYDLWDAYSELPENDHETPLYTDKQMTIALVNTFENHGWYVDMPHGRYIVKEGYKIAKGGMMADGGEVPNVNNLYALMTINKETGYGSLSDGKVYTKKEALLRKDIYDDKLFYSANTEEDMEMEIKIFSVEELLKRKTLPKTSKEIILSSYEKAKKSIVDLTERFGDDYNWKEDFKKGGKVKEPTVTRGFFDDEAYEYNKGGYMAEGGVTEKDKLGLKILKALSGFNDGQTLNGLLELLGYSQYRFGKYATENQVNDVKKELESLIKLGYVEESGLGFKQTSYGRRYLDAFDYGSYAEGGVTEKEVVDSNAQMVLSKIKEVHHHADELGNIVTKKSDIEAWVVAKIERASTDLSDITHYLDGQHQKMSMGGGVYNHVHKMDKN
jgi:hypothetical protein